MTGTAQSTPESSSSHSTPAGMTGRAFAAERIASTTFCGSAPGSSRRTTSRGYSLRWPRESPEVLGYYALNAHAVATDDLGADRPRRAPRTGTIPALYLSMIAVDRTQQGKGLGSDLAVDALGRARNVAGEVGLKLVVLDVIDDGGDEVSSCAAGSSTGASVSGAFRIARERMFITIDTIRAMFGNE